MNTKRIVRVLLVAATLAAAPTAIQAASPPGLERAMEVQDRYTPTLMARDDIEGTAVGYDSSGEAVIKVYTARAGVPGIPPAFEQVPIEVVVTGRFVVRADPTSRFDRPVPIGVSSGHPDITAGTLGCRVKDFAVPPNFYALSNNHVYANSNNASYGDNVLQPGNVDGGQNPADAIGTLFDYQEIYFSGVHNDMDAAIAAVSTAGVGYSTPTGDGYGAPTSTTVEASVNQVVQKYGRTTGWTHGQVTATNATIDVCYQTRGPFNCAKTARFVDQIMISPGSFSDGGDSGSCIVDSNRNPVGLLFAGSNTHTIANRIQPVLDRFGVTIDDGSGGGSINVEPTADFSHAISCRTVNFSNESADDGALTWSWDFGDGSPISNEQNPSHTYGATGTYRVTLVVTEDVAGGATDGTFQDVTIIGAPPTAAFSYSATDLTVNFTDQSTDDCPLDSWSWDFGDGSPISTAQNPSHTYSSAGDYNVSLTVTDEDFAINTTSQPMTVSESPTVDITLSVNGYKVRGQHHADLTWSGAKSDPVDVYRDGEWIASTVDDGFYTDTINRRGGGSYSYQICDTSTCSAVVTVTF